MPGERYLFLLSPIYLPQGSPNPLFSIGSIHQLLNLAREYDQGCQDFLRSDWTLHSVANEQGGPCWLKGLYYPPAAKGAWSPLGGFSAFLRHLLQYSLGTSKFRFA